MLLNIVTNRAVLPGGGLFQTKRRFGIGGLDIVRLALFGGANLGSSWWSCEVSGKHIVPGGHDFWPFYYKASNVRR